MRSVTAMRLDRRRAVEAALVVTAWTFHRMIAVEVAFP